MYFQITFQPGHMHENLTQNGSQSNTDVTRKKGPIKNNMFNLNTMKIFLWSFYLNHSLLLTRAGCV